MNWALAEHSTHSASNRSIGSVKAVAERGVVVMQVLQPTQQLEEKRAEALHPEPDVGSCRTDHHPLHQRPDGPRLLRREEMLPQRVEPMQRVLSFALNQIWRLPARRPPGETAILGWLAAAGSACSVGALELSKVIRSMVVTRGVGRFWEAACWQVA